MRSCLMGLSALLIAASSSAWAGSDQDGIGFPSYAFALSWTSLSSGHFQPVSPTRAPVRLHTPKAMTVDDGRMQHVLEATFASAGDDKERREIALSEMTTPWPQPQRRAFQRVRDAQAAYAAGDDQRAARFAALAGRVADGTGRSAAVDGSASATLDTAYAAALSRQDDVARAKTEAAQKAFVAYRDAFMAFAEGHSPGTGAGVVAELDRQRATDLAGNH